MPRFFVEDFEKTAKISGDDARHISRSLRMKVGEILTVCDTKGVDYFCTITSLSDDAVELEINTKRKTESEPTIDVTLFQCMPKGEKIESVVQKSVELGVRTIVPVISSRCISRPDAKSGEKKVKRLNKIAAEAAKQSGRGILPTVENITDFKSMVNRLKNYDLAVCFYELYGEPLRTLIENHKKIAIIIGSEGGFSVDEIETLKSEGVKIATLGKRILRTETAPLAALTSIMLLSGNLE